MKQYTPRAVHAPSRKLEIKVRLLMTFIVICLPLIIVWAAWIMTGASFSYTSVFTSQPFAFLTLAYEICFGLVATLAIWRR